MATTNGDPGIICYQHCGPKVFTLTLTERCPACGKNTIDTKFKLLPFRIPYPFVRASQYPCSVILRPTIGDFLNDYYNSTDLHICVTTSNGTIVEFDRCGLRWHRDKGESKWNQSLLVKQIPDAWMEHWDDILNKVCNQQIWTSQSYDEDNHNCYSFVLSFLQELNYDALGESAKNKSEFCEKYIVPRTTTAGKYISLYRKLRDKGYYIHNHS